MASPAKIAQPLPDTLPEDFSEWDGGASAAAVPVISAPLKAVPEYAPAPKAPAQQPKSQIKVVAVMDGSTIAPMFNAATFNAAQEALAKSRREEKERIRRQRMVLTGIAVALILVLVVLTPLVFPGMLPGLVKVKQSVVSMGSSKGSEPSTIKIKPSPSTLLSKTAQPVASITTPAPSVPQPVMSTQTADSDYTEPGPAPVESKMMDDQLSAPKRIPQDVKAVPKPEAPPAPGFAGTGMDGLAISGNNALGKVFGGGKPKVNVSAAPSRLNLSSGVAAGLLIRKTMPVYPAIAKTARVSGTIVLQATIAKSGILENIHVVSGPVMLQQSALDAVKSWRYRPYMLDGKPVDVDTSVNVVFTSQ